MTHGRRPVSALRAFALLALVAPDAPAQLAVYTDSLQNGFSDWLSGTRDLAQTDVVPSGTAAISFEPDSRVRLFLHRDAGFTGTVHEEWPSRTMTPTGSSR